VSGVEERHQRRQRRRAEQEAKDLETRKVEALESIAEQLQDVRTQLRNISAAGQS
jgi:hypothetical protein